MDSANNQKVLWTHSAHHSSEGDQHRSHRVGAGDKSDDVHLNGVVFSIEAVMEDFVPEVLEEDVVLRDEGIDEEGVGNGAPGITSDEGHEEAETDEHHHVDILEGWIALSA